MIALRAAPGPGRMRTLLLLVGCLSVACRGAPPPTTAMAPAASEVAGRIVYPHGAAIYGNARQYIKDLYLGRLAQGDAFVLASRVVGRDEFNLQIIQVRVTTNDELVGRVGWISLTTTDLVDRYDPEHQTIE
jgi:hypothetical protein